MPRDPSRKDRTPSKPSRDGSARSSRGEPSRARAESADRRSRPVPVGRARRPGPRGASQSAGSESRLDASPSIRTARSSETDSRPADPVGELPTALHRQAGRSAQRAGRARQDSQSAARSGTAIPDGATIHLLDREVRADLRSLSKPTAEIVGAHLAAAGLYLEDDPRPGARSRARRSRPSRSDRCVREAVGIAAYRAQQWAEALSELRAARRITGDPRNLAVIADTERALGRPAQAVRMLDDPDVARLDGETRAELLIVVAGARRDLGQMDAALGVLARGGLDTQRPSTWIGAPLVRLRRRASGGWAQGRRGPLVRSVGRARHDRGDGRGRAGRRVALKGLSDGGLFGLHSGRC